MIDLLTLVANARGTTERRVANDYTHEQIMHITKIYIKDRLLVLDTIAKQFGSKRGASGNASNDRPASRGGRAKFFGPDYVKGRMRHGRDKVNYVDLDGPMEKLTPYLGKKKVVKGKIIRRK